MKQPNILVIVTDDQGHADLSCMGAPDFRTPHLDSLASAGVRFTDWYAASPVCSPSRAAIMTGRYPGHAGVRSILAGHRMTSGLLPEVPTLAAALKPLGYRTTLAGKWHLGVAEECRPHNHGFDHWKGFLAGCIDYYSHIFYHGLANKTNMVAPVHDLWEDNREIWENGRYSTEWITDYAVHTVREAAKTDDPFFLYVGYNAPHFPLHAPSEYLDRFPDLPPERRIMAAMLSAVDDGVGAILDELDRNGIREDTCIVFMSDNGPSRETANWLNGCETPYHGGQTGALRGHKFSLFEGGIRVPGLICWPRRIPAGQVIAQPACGIDLFPTLLTAAGGDPSAYNLDGIDLLPMLIEGAPLPPRDLYWEMNGQTAIRRGTWKLVLHGQLREGAQPEDVFLSNLDDDPGEQINLRDEYPEITAALTHAANTWRDGIEETWVSHWHGRAAAH